MTQLLFFPAWNTKHFYSPSKLIIQSSSHPVTTRTSSPSACLLFFFLPPLSIPSTSPLSCHSHAPTTKVPRCLKSPALISSSKRVTHVGSASLITAWNHSGLTGREIKTAARLYPALAGLGGCLSVGTDKQDCCWGEKKSPPASLLWATIPSRYPKNIQHNLRNEHKGMSPLSGAWPRVNAALSLHA